MLWRAIANWILAGCLSAAALNFSTSSRQPADLLREYSPSRSEGALPPFEERQESPLMLGGLAEAAEPLPTSPPGQTTPPVTPPAKETVAVEASTSNRNEPTSESTPKARVSEEYQVQPEDVLQITVYEEPDLTTKVRVTGSGEINFPFLGRIQVAGLSVTEVQEKITKLLAEDYLVNPQVQVFIETYHAREVFVTGAVNRPGAYPLPAGKITTLMEAISMAGGFSEEAAVNSTRIVRIENGEETRINVKAKDIIQGDKTKDVEVYPNDVIFVPESFF